jgi:hypothetical protein
LRWVLVPAEPTETMLDAASWHSNYEDMWEAMLQARPRMTYWRWWRNGTDTHLTIVTFGLAFEASRQAFSRHWELTRKLSDKGGEIIYRRATPAMVKKAIRGRVGELLARQFAGVDR